jgi:hypothetical protein
MSNELILPSGVDKLSVPQKVVAGGLMLGGLYFALPILLSLMVNLVMVLLIGVPLAFLAYNYQMIWLLFKNLSWHTTKWLIGLDVLSYMDRYVDYVRDREQLILNSKRDLIANVEGVRGEIQERESSYASNMKKADVADRQGNSAQCDVYTSNAADDKDFIASLAPIKEEADKQVMYLGELAEVFGTKRQQLEYKVKAQKSKYKSLQTMSRGMGAASEVISGSGAESAIWKETQEQLVSQMNQFTANIKTFEEVVKPAIESGRFDRQLRKEEGQKLLEQFRATNFELKEKR